MEAAGAEVAAENENPVWVAPPEDTWAVVLGKVNGAGEEEDDAVPVVAAVVVPKLKVGALEGG